MFLPVSGSRQIGSSVYRQIGLTSVCRTGSFVGFSVIESPDRSTVTPITITLFSFFCQKDVGNRHQKQNQLEHLTLDFEYEVSQRDNFVTLAFIVICDSA